MRTIISILSLLIPLTLSAQYTECYVSDSTSLKTCIIITSDDKCVTESEELYELQYCDSLTKQEKQFYNLSTGIIRQNNIIIYSTEPDYSEYITR